MAEHIDSVVVTVTGANGSLTATFKGTWFRGSIEGEPEMLAEGDTVVLVLEPAVAGSAEASRRLTGRVRWLVADGAETEHAYVDHGVVFRFDTEVVSGAPELDLGAAEERIPSRVYRRPFPLITALDALDDDTVLGPTPDAVTVALVSEEEILREPSGVIGTLRQVSLAEVVQGLEMGRKTARVDISAPDNTMGRLFLDGGSLVHAEHERAEGLEAFFSLAAFKSGAYRVRFGRVTSRRTIQDPTAYVVLEAMRRLDEAEYESGLPVAALEGAEDFVDTADRERAFLSIDDARGLVPEDTRFDGTSPQDAPTVEAALPSVERLLVPKAAPAPTVRVSVSSASSVVELPPPLPSDRVVDDGFNEVDDDQVLTEALLEDVEVGGEDLTETTTDPRTRKDEPPLVHTRKAKVFGGFFQEVDSGDDDLDTKLSDSLAFIGDSGAHDLDAEVEVTNA